jgi:hypothetical protein
VDSDKLPYKRNQYHQNAAALCNLPSPKHSSMSRTKLLELCEILGLFYTLRHDLQDMPESGSKPKHSDDLLIHLKLSIGINLFVKSLVVNVAHVGKPIASRVCEAVLATCYTRAECNHVIDKGAEHVLAIEKVVGIQRLQFGKRKFAA